jgi:hypothetical protein
MTGMQRKHPVMKNYFHIAEMIKDMFGSRDHSIIYIQDSLRSANDIYKRGGHVTKKFMDKSFSVLYNNKRFIIDVDPITGKEISPQGNLLDSRPLERLEDFLLLKQKKDLVRVEKHVNDKAYNRTIEKMRSKYTSYIDLGIRRFISVVCIKGLDQSFFKNNDHIISFIEGYNDELKGHIYDSDKNELVKKVISVKPRLISDLRYRGKINKLLPLGIKELDDFIKYIVRKSKEEGLDITEEDFSN